MTVAVPVEVRVMVLVESPFSAGASAVALVVVAGVATEATTVELLAEAGGSAGAAGSVVEPPPLTVTLTLLSKLQGEMSVTPGVFPLTNFPPNSTEEPGLGYTTSTSPGVIHWPPPKMLASYMRGPVKEVDPFPTTVTGAQFM